MLSEALPDKYLHVGIIMDGNGRWAKQRFLPKVEGHRRGAQVLRDVVSHASLMGISHLTVFAFSTENWNRSAHEINDLMNLLRYFLKNELDFFHKKKVIVRVIGDLNKLPDDICNNINDVISKTASNEGLVLTIAISYGGKEEIVNAAQNIARLASSGHIDINNINEENFHEFMYSSHLPMLDVLVRTSGEMRISNFMLWHMAYAELFFIPTLWPDFTFEHLENIVEQYKYRDRRFGTRAVYDEHF